MELHSEFIKEMREMLGGEYQVFADSFNQPHNRGIRINTLKFKLSEAEKLGLPIKGCSFSPMGYYLCAEEGGIGNSPWHHAGAFYSQEPSAMSAVTVLNPQPGDKVLDMCAAPGGKSTQIAALLNGDGLLWSNEYVKKRAQILLSNIERMGVRNCVVSNTHPDALADKLEGFFDKVLVDAPCSGEGMFRRDSQAIAEWTPEHSAACAVRQLAILESAAKCLREGGILVYSTCTFSFCENEDTVAAFLDAHSDFEIIDSGVDFGRCGYNRSDRFDLTKSRRIFPMDGGEGHFVARLQKKGENYNGDIAAVRFSDKPTELEKLGERLYRECFSSEPYGRIAQIGESCYILPKAMPDTKGLGVLRGGVLLGEAAKGRIEPAHALFMAARADECRQLIELSPDSSELNVFLHGGELDAPSEYKGFAAVACGSAITGFGKCSGGRMKNRYPKGLRILK